VLPRKRIRPVGGKPTRVSQTKLSRASFSLEDRCLRTIHSLLRAVPEIVKYLKTNASKREIDLHPDVAEYLRQYAVGKSGLLFHTASGTPHLYGNLEDRWLTPRLIKLKLDEEGMGWHAFKRFRKT
jgi:hypothetical protein